ncbi:hypothetical protein [Arsenophonus nasoniae]|uniref:hypothetical protein n=1 Tax=Arsenophonus nasoniae TaxID=638 RepID=UPI003879EE90
MNIQNTVNNREGLLYAKNQGGDIFNRLNKSTYKKSVGHYENFVVQKLNNMGVQAVREVRTKESIKNNRLIQFVQYTKQPSNRSLQYFIYSNLSSAKK